MYRVVTLLLVALALVACESVTDPNTKGVAPPQLSMTGVVVGTETRITFNEASQLQPKISGDRIVWHDDRDVEGDPAADDADWNIYMYDLETGVETQITSDPAGQWRPDIANDVIVYEHYGNDNEEGIFHTDIYMYDLHTGIESAISSDLENEEYPLVSGTRIVWNGRRGEDRRDIFMYDPVEGGEIQEIATGPADQMSPAISGDVIVWVEAQEARLRHIYVYDLAKPDVPPHPITEDVVDYARHVPQISGNLIVWFDARAGNYDIYMYDLVTDTETQITDDPGSQYWPTVSGTRIAWADNRNGNWDIYMYDLVTDTESQITDDPSMQYRPTLSGDRVVWHDLRNDGGDIYMFDISAVLPGSIEVIINQIEQYLTDGSISNHGIGEALNAFLRQVGGDMANNDCEGAHARLDHFIEFVTRKSGKQIETAAAEMLIELALALKNNLGCE